MLVKEDLRSIARAAVLTRAFAGAAMALSAESVVTDVMRLDRVRL